LKDIERLHEMLPKLVKAMVMSAGLNYLIKVYEALKAIDRWILRCLAYYQHL